MFAATITPNAINLMIDGKMRTIDKTHVNFERVNEALKNLSNLREGSFDYNLVINELRDLCDIRSFLARATEGKVQISDNEVRYDGKTVGGVIAERLIELLKGGYDVKPVARFLERVMQNPDKRAQTDLYAWLEVAKMPITPDGYFLAWKYVNKDYTSRYDSKTLNRIGDKPMMKREDCDPNPYNECSRGLHFCAFGYLGSDAYERTMIVKVDPADVVAIPMDYNRQKGRAWTYEIVGEVEREECATFFKGRPVVDDYDDGLAQHVDGDDDDEDTDEQTFDEAHDTPLSALSGEAAAAEDGVEAELEAIETDDAEEAAAVHDAEDAAIGDALTDDAQPKKKPRAFFEHGGKRYSRKKLRRMLKMFGQRGTARLTGIPRTTLQDWKDEIYSD